MADFGFRHVSTCSVESFVRFGRRKTPVARSPMVGRGRAGKHHRHGIGCAGSARVDTDGGTGRGVRRRLLVVPEPGTDDLVERLDRLSHLLRDADWRMHDIAVMPVPDIRR